MVGAFGFALCVAGLLMVGSAAFDKAVVHVRNKILNYNDTRLVATNRIHSGNEAEEGMFPFMVFMIATSRPDAFRQVSTCSASLIAPQWVLTAAHCVVPREKAAYIIVVAGRANIRNYCHERLARSFEENVSEKKYRIQERRVVDVRVNPKYSTARHIYDLALLKVEEPFRIDDTVQVASLSNGKMEEMMSCTAVGWGLSDMDQQTLHLMYADEVYAQTPSISCHYIHDGPFICLEEGGPGICKGDSGSPLMCDQKIWGVASFSMSPIRNPRCVDKEKEEYYSQVYSELDWMKSVMKSCGWSASSCLFTVALLSAFGLSRI